MKKVLLMLVMTVLAAAGRADIVSWNYSSITGDQGYSSAYVNQATDVSGAVPAAYWNDAVLDGRTVDLLDSTGAATTIDIASLHYPWGAWHVTNSHPGVDADSSYNREIINGYLNGTTGVGGCGITLSGIGYPAYDIIVYFSSDTAGRTGRVTDGTTDYYFNTLGSASINDASGNAVLVQAMDTTTSGYSVAANYAVFSGLSGDTQTLMVYVDSGGGLAAIQITEGDYDFVITKDPTNGEADVAPDLSDRTIANNLSWSAPGDPNIAEIKGYDIYLDPNEVKVSNRDLGCLIADSTAAGFTQYDPASDFDYLTTYYWVVDTRYTRDDDPNLGTTNETIYTGSPITPWSFETISAAPVIQTYDSVVVTESMLSASLSAVVTDFDGDLSSAAFTLLTDDIDYPNPGSYTLTPNVTDPYAPSCTFTADTPGYYKIKLTVSDGTNTVNARAEVAIYNDPNACAAAQFAPSWDGFNAMDFDTDCDVDLNDFATYALQWLDDRSLDAPENYDWPIPYTPLVNGIINGNFETGDLLGYYQENVTITDVDPFEGTYSAEWTVTGGRGGVVTYRDLKASTNYLFSVQIIGGVAGGTNEFLVRKGISDVYATAEVEGSWIPSGTVQTVTIPFTTLAGDEGATFEFVIFGTTEGTYYKVDDLRLVELP